MENDIFEKMPVPKAYFKLALPVVLGMVVSLIYNMVDTWFIARTQDTRLVAGVSLCAPLFTLMVAMGDMFGLGGSAVLSGHHCLATWASSAHRRLLTLSHLLLPLDLPGN